MRKKSVPSVRNILHNPHYSRGIRIKNVAQHSSNGGEKKSDKYFLYNGIDFILSYDMNLSFKFQNVNNKSQINSTIHLQNICYNFVSRMHLGFVS